MRTTLLSELFQKGLEKLKLEYEWRPLWQEKVDAMIASIKSGEDIKEATTLWEALSKWFSDAGIDTILLVCTDLNVIFKYVSISCRVIDSSLCLSEAVVNRWVETHET